AADQNLWPSSGNRVRHMVLVAIRPSESQFVQQAWGEAREQLSADHVGSVLKVCRRIQCVLGADRCIKRIVVPEVVVTGKELMLAGDIPIRTNVEELGVLYARRDRDQLGIDSDRCRIRRGNRVGLRQTALQVLISAKHE